MSDSWRPHGPQPHQASLSITNSRSLLNLMSIELVMPSNHLILCNPLLLPPSIFPSIRVFTNESALRIRWPKYWSFSFNISLSNEHPGLISFRMDWLDLFAVQAKSSLIFPTTSYLFQKQFPLTLFYDLTFTSASLTPLKPLTIWITTNCGKLLKRWEYQTTLSASCKTSVQQEATVRAGHGTTDWVQNWERSMSRLFIVTLLI